MSNEASSCFTPRRAVGRMDAEGGGASRWRYVASLVIALAMASSTGAPTLLTATVSIAGDDPALRLACLR